MAYGYGYGWGFAPYVSVASRRLHAAREAAALRKKGRRLEPVTIQGRTVARSFWGRAWCRNLERYSDFANRLPRGRSYVANGLVLDLKVAPGLVTALVYGSSLYEIEVRVAPLPGRRWSALRRECAGKIDSLVELLDGRLSAAVMEVVTRPETGLFPSPAEIRMACSCPDSARLCKHLAAVLYGIGSRLDHRPELLFLLRQADHLELVTAAADAPLAGTTARDEALAGSDLSAIFGIDLEGGGPAAPVSPRGPKTPPKPRKAPAKPPVRRKASGPRPKAAPAREVTARELTALGISRATIQNWLFEGVLGRTPRRGVYLRTRATAPRVEAYLGRRRG